MATKKKVKQDDGSKEKVTEFMKQVFEIQLADIDKKIERINARQKELNSGAAELEEKLEDFRKDKSDAITEQEQLLASRQEEKVQKRNQMVQLSKEIKIRIERYEKQLQQMEEKFKEVVVELTRQREEREEVVKILEDYKLNKERYNKELETMKNQLEEMEIQHQRNLFEIDGKWEMAKVRVKKELESRLLQLSIDFRQTSQKRIGNPCHRVTQENKSIENEISSMGEELAKYQDKCSRLRSNINAYKNERRTRALEKDKTTARTVVQNAIIKSLLKERLKLMEILKEYVPVETDNKVSMKKLKAIVSDIERKLTKIEELKQSLEKKIEDTNAMNEAFARLKKSARRLQALTRNGLKIAEETMALPLIPQGETDEEVLMNREINLSIFKTRRDAVFQKKGRLLQYLLDFLAKAQSTKEDLQPPPGLSETFKVDQLDFSQIYSRSLATEKVSELKILPSTPLSDEEITEKSPKSDVSLPRSAELFAGQQVEWEGELDVEGEEDSEGQDTEDDFDFFEDPDEEEEAEPGDP